MDDNKPQPIELTPKYSKVMQAIGALLLLLGMVSCSMGASGDFRTATILFFSAGLALNISGRFFAWWDRG